MESKYIHTKSILVECLLISCLPGNALRMLVESTCVLEALPGKHNTERRAYMRGCGCLAEARVSFCLTMSICPEKCADVNSLIPRDLRLALSIFC